MILQYQDELLIFTSAGEGEAPSFTSTLEPIRVMDGEKTTLTVTYNAQPAPNVQWFRNDALLVPSADFEITTDSTTSTLVIVDTMPEDSGLYKVVLTNPHGDAVSAVSVEVIEEEERVEQVVTPIAEAIPEEEILPDDQVETTEQVTEVLTQLAEEPSLPEPQPAVVDQQELPEAVSPVPDTNKIASEKSVTSTIVSRQEVKQEEIVVEAAELDFSKPEVGVQETPEKESVEKRSTVLNSTVVTEDALVESTAAKDVQAEIAEPSKTEIAVDGGETGDIPTEAAPVTQEETLQQSSPSGETPLEQTAPKETSIHFEASKKDVKVSDVKPSIQTEELQEVQAAAEPQEAFAQPSDTAVEMSKPEKEKPTQQAFEVSLEEKEHTVDEGLEGVEPVSQKPSGVIVDQGTVFTDKPNVEARTAMDEQQLVSSNDLPQTKMDSTSPDDTDISTSLTESEMTPASAPVSESKAELEETTSLISETTAETQPNDEVAPVEESISPAVVTSEAKEMIVERSDEHVSLDVDEVKPVGTKLEEVTVDAQMAEGLQEPAETTLDVSETAVGSSAVLHPVTTDSTIAEKIEVLSETPDQLQSSVKASTLEDNIVVTDTQPLIPAVTSSMQEADIVLPQEKAMSEQPEAIVQQNLQSIDVNETDEIGGFQVESAKPEQLVVDASQPNEEQLSTSAVPALESTDVKTVENLSEIVTDSSIPEEMEIKLDQPEMKESETLLEKPSITGKSENLDFDFNQDMELSVKFIGQPQPVVSWYKNDEPVKESERVM